MDSERAPFRSSWRWPRWVLWVAEHVRRGGQLGEATSVSTLASWTSRLTEGFRVSKRAEGMECGSGFRGRQSVPVASSPSLGRGPPRPPVFIHPQPPALERQPKVPSYWAVKRRAANHRLQSFVFSWHDLVSGFVSCKPRENPGSACTLTGRKSC
jgi:hypothetical protein